MNSISEAEQILYISDDGLDTFECITNGTKCKTLRYTTENARPETSRLVILMEADSSLRRDHEMRLDHLNKQPELKEVVVTSLVSKELDSINFVVKSFMFNPGLTIIFDNLIFNNMTIFIQNVHITFRDVTFIDTVIKDFSLSSMIKYRISIDIENCEFIHANAQINGIQLSASQNVRFLMENVTLNASLIHVETEQLWVIMRSVENHNDIGTFLFKTTAFVPIRTTIELLDTNLSCMDKKCQMIKGVQPGVQIMASNIYLSVIHCSFSYLRGALQIENLDVPIFETFFYTKLVDTSFIGNSKQGVGGAIFLKFTRSQTLSNAVFQMHNTNFTENNAQKADYTSANGGGLAIISNLGPLVQYQLLRVIIVGCKFLDNFAHDEGGSLYLSGYSYANIFKSIFLVEKMRAFPSKGLHLYSNGEISLMGTNISLGLTKSNVEAVSVQIFDFEMKISSLDMVFACPDWNSPVILPDFRPSQILNRPVLQGVTCRCSSCSESKYSPSVTQYFVSYHDGQSSVSIESSTGDLSIPECIPCPYGGHCPGHRLAARPNYYGFWEDGEITFQRCPADYCCTGSDTAPCDSYNSCNGNRTGFLCGSCIPDHSMSILSNYCVPDKHCGEEVWFWPLSALAVIAYMLWYTLKDDIAKIISYLPLKLVNRCASKSNSQTSVQGNNLNPRNKNSHGGQLGKGFETGNGKTVRTRHGIKTGTFDGIDPENDFNNDLDPVVDTDIDKGYFGILTYFVQASVIMRIDVEFHTVETGEESMLDRAERYMNQLLNIELSSVSYNICPIVTLQASGKILFHGLFLLGIYCSWILAYILAFAIFQITEKMYRTGTKWSDIIRRKLIRGIVEIIKYTYSGFVGITIMAMTCVKVLDEFYWKFDGTVNCLAPWQIGILSVGLGYTIPFFLVIIIGIKLMKNHQISGILFLFGCIFPPPFLFYCISLLCYDKVTDNNAQKITKDSPNSIYIQSGKSDIDARNDVENDDPEVGCHGNNNTSCTNTILSVLQGPYITSHSDWEAVMIVRRLFLSITPLINNAIIQMIFNCSFCAIFLVHHLMVKPFIFKPSNKVETLSLLLLIWVAIVNLLKASYTEMGEIPTGPAADIFQTLKFCENLLIVLVIAHILFIEVNLILKRNVK